jgi:3-hydroxyisobutyrate dehydrogenase-like beta-hydroxyacid dehydrogenase
MKSLLFNDEAERALRGKLLVQLGTVSGRESLETAIWAKDIGASYLEGSIIGFPSDITGGTATIVYAGPRSMFDANSEILSCLGRDSRHIGEAHGSVASLESAIYFFAYGVMISFIQGAAIAAAKGIEVGNYTDTVLARMPNYPRRLGWLGELIERRGHDEVQASLRVHAAAFAGSLLACREAGIDDTLPAALMYCMERAIAAGRGEQELTAIFDVLLKKPQ